MRSALFNWIRFSLVGLFVLSIVPSVSAQKERVNALAKPMADAIARSRNKTVVVFDFAGLDRSLGPLGTALADDFSSALAAAGRKLQLEDRERLKKMIQDNGLQPENINDPGIATWLAADLGAQALVLGTLNRDGESVVLSVNSYSVKDGKGIALFKTAIPLTDEMKDRISVKTSADESVLPDGKCASTDSPPCAGAHGYSSPKCIRCPPADYSQEARDDKAQGTVTLLVVVDIDGRAKGIRVARALPYGLTLQAIRAVQNWTFQPATGPDGNPAEVLELIEVSFHLY